MKEELLERWRHSHSFGQDQKRPGEFRTFIVIALTASMMVVEITTGIIYGLGEPVTIDRSRQHRL